MSPQSTRFDGVGTSLPPSRRAPEIIASRTGPDSITADCAIAVPGVIAPTNTPIVHAPMTANCPADCRERTLATPDYASVGVALPPLQRVDQLLPSIGGIDHRVDLEVRRRFEGLALLVEFGDEAIE